MYQTDDKIGLFGLKPNSYKQNNLTTYTYYLPGNSQQNLEKSKKNHIWQKPKKIKNWQNKEKNMFEPLIIITAVIT